MIAADLWPAGDVVHLALTHEQFLVLLQSAEQRIIRWEKLREMTPGIAAAEMEASMPPLEGYMVITLRDLLNQCDDVYRRITFADPDEDSEAMMKIKEACQRIRDFKITLCPVCGAGG